MNALREVLYTPTHEPALQLAAAVVALAVDDSRAGDYEAWRWLCEQSRPWLSLLLHDGIDLETLHQRILEAARPRRGWQFKQCELELSDVR